MSLRRWFIGLKDGVNHDMVDYAFLLGFLGLVLTGALNRFEEQVKGCLYMLSGILPP
jgi:hypothetical protein